MPAVDDNPGVGPLISTAMVAAIGSGEAFERGRDFAAWLGLVPHTLQASDTSRATRQLMFLSEAWMGQSKEIDRGLLVKDAFP